MIKNVILDIGGVLVDYNKKKYYTMKGYSDEMASRLEAATMDSPYWEHYDIGLMPEEWIRNKMKESDPDLSDDIDKSLKVHTDVVTKREGSRAWIESLREMGFRLLVLSNFSENALKSCPEAMDFLGESLGGSGKDKEWGVISEGIISCREHMIKPYPEIYALILTRYDLKPEETVFVDDTDKNLIPASQIYDIRTIRFTSREQVTDELKRISGRE